MPSFPWSSARSSKHSAVPAATHAKTELNHQAALSPALSQTSTSTRREEEDVSASKRNHTAEAGVMGTSAAMAEGAGNIPDDGDRAVAPTLAAGGKQAIDHAPAVAPGGGGGPQQPLQIGKVRFALVFLAMMLSIFLFALDQLIVATAIPRITTEFNSLASVSWIVNGFFITLLAFNPIYSQWLQVFPSKIVVLAAVLIFEVGSLVCGVAPNMNVLIFGRALAGLGAAGIFSGNLVVLAEITTLQQRAKLFGVFGVNFAIASVIGPLVGGAFTDKPNLTWRWCFYINLPIGGFALIALLLLLPHQAPLGQKDTWKGYGMHLFWDFLKCDYVGVVLALGWSVALILALQWGGATKPWNDGSVIACLVLIPVLAIAFFLWEKWLGHERAMLPLHLFANRNMLGTAIVAASGFAVFMITVYYISEMYQAVYNKSAVTAGVQLLPLILVQIVVLIVSGRLVAAFGYIWPFLLVGPVLITVASGLLYTVRATTSNSTIMGFQAILGVGIGAFLQNSVLISQFEYEKQPRLISKATGLSTFFGFAGRIIGISIAGSVFQNVIRRDLKHVEGLPEDLAEAVASSAGAVYALVPENLRAPVLAVYAKTLDDVFIIGVPFGIIAIAAALIIERKKYATKKAPPKAAEKAAEEGEAGVESIKSQKA